MKVETQLVLRALATLQKEVDGELEGDDPEVEEARKIIAESMRIPKESE